MISLSNKLASLRPPHSGSPEFCEARHILRTVLTDVLLLRTDLTMPAGVLLNVSHSFRLTDDGLHADLVHEISWRVSSPADPQTAVDVFKCSTHGSYVVLVFPVVSSANGRWRSSHQRPSRTSIHA